MWPDGYRASPQSEPEEETKACRALLARAKLIGSVPGNGTAVQCFLHELCSPHAEDLRRLIGTDTTTRGVARLVLQYKTTEFTYTVWPKHLYREDFQVYHSLILMIGGTSPPGMQAVQHVSE